MRYITPADQVHFIIDIAELPEADFTRVLRLMTAVLADWSWMTFAHAETGVLTLDEGLSARLEDHMLLISKVGLLQRDGSVYVIDIVPEAGSFVRRGRGPFDEAGSQQLISTDQIAYTVADEETDPATAERGADFAFANVGHPGRAIYGVRNPAFQARAVVHEPSSRIYVDARDGVEPGQPLYVEYVPDLGIRDAGGSIVIPSDAQLVVAYATLEALYLVKDPNRSSYFNQKFVEARSRYARKHTPDSLSDIVRAFRTSYTYTHRSR